MKRAAERTKPAPETGEARGPRGSSGRRLLVVEEISDADIATAAFTRAGIHPVAAQSASEASRLVAQQQFDAVLLNLRSNAAEGLHFLRTLRERAPQTPVIVVAGDGNAERAARAAHGGGDHYVVRSLDVSELIGTVKRGLEGRQAAAESQAAVDEAPVVEGFEGVVGHSPKMREVHRMVSIVAPTDATVLLMGETGTGKELLARSVHRQSRRANGPWIVMHCGAIPETLLETEIFGHEKGAFTNAIAAKPGRFERAEGGSIFLDEVGDMSLAMQVKFLRVLQERTLERVGGVRSIKVDCRVIAATNRDLRRMVREGIFRADLYYRLAVVPLTLPSLRERPEDLPALVQHFLHKYRRQTGKALRGFAPSAMEQLRRHPWPGNVRELEYCIERAVLLAPGEIITADDIHLDDTPLLDV
ncbi:MAG: sigma-54-dependent Fis family transcriptional regulator [Armatimonadetes bacterium]|nr:sigma-54-dependent Fis family transcriptional regulator [Armatimonadota bacterium]